MAGKGDAAAVAPRVGTAEVRGVDGAVAVAAADDGAPMVPVVDASAAVDWRAAAGVLVVAGGGGAGGGGGEGGVLVDAGGPTPPCPPPRLRATAGGAAVTPLRWRWIAASPRWWP